LIAVNHRAASRGVEEGHTNHEASWLVREPVAVLPADVRSSIRASLSGWVLSLIGVVFALIGIFVWEGISIKRLWIMLGVLGYYFGLRGQDRWARFWGS